MNIFYIISELISIIFLANRQLYTAPDNDELEKKIDQVDQAFAKGNINKRNPFKNIKDSF
jgi:hypothetical protein